MLLSEVEKCYSLSVVLFEFGKSSICRLKTLILHYFLFPTFLLEHVCRSN